MIHECRYWEAVSVHLVDRIQDRSNHLDQFLSSFLLNCLDFVNSISPLSRNIDLDECCSTEVDSLVVHVYNILTLLEVRLSSLFLHVLDCFFLWHDLCKCEECRLEDCVCSLAHSNLLSQVDGIDCVELDVVLCNVSLCSCIQVVIEFIE